MPKKRSGAANHLHRYQKVDIGRNGNEYLVYRCTKPLCTHYIRLDMAKGTMCECNRCGKPMIITSWVLVSSSGGPQAKPHCDECKKTRKSKEINAEALANFLKAEK